MKVVPRVSMNSATVFLGGKRFVIMVHDLTFSPESRHKAKLLIRIIAKMVSKIPSLNKEGNGSIFKFASERGKCL